MKKIIIRSAVILVSLSLVLVSCTRDEPPPMLRMALQTEPSSLDPAYAVDYSSGLITSLIHSNLVRIDTEGKLCPDLASSWEVSDDGKECLFHLGPSRFANGRRVKARDVLFSFKRLLSPSALSPRWWVLAPLKGARAYHKKGDWDSESIEIINDSTVALRLERGTAHFLSLLSMPAAGIVCPEQMEEKGIGYGRNPCGSGPWSLSEWVESERMILEPNGFYAGNKASIDGISFRFIPEAMTRIAEFEVGNLDILEIPYAELKRWRTAGLRLEKTEELRIVYIGLNTRKYPFNDRRVRRALNMAIDVEAVIAKILFGAGRRARGVVPPVLGGQARQSDIYRYNPQMAKSLLEEAGLGDGFSMELWQRESPEGGRILECVQAYLGNIGIKVKLVTRDWSAFKQAVDHGTPDAFYLDWFADYPDAENFLAPLFHSSNRGGGGNRTGYKNDRVDSLIDFASRLPDNEKRMKLLLEAEEIVYSDAPWIFLWFPVRYEAVSGRLNGYTIPVIFNGQRFLNISF
jgi:peptide/nickel transport system substrate-binding protein/oligopeptide transport system substrate-binding protein